jgi:branched-chain amino acid aminotransferase
MTQNPKTVPNLDADAEFGKHTSDHLLLVKWDASSGWKNPEIVPFGDLSLDPAAAVFHYANCCFEEMKAYKGSDGRTLLFRPE